MSDWLPIKRFTARLEKLEKRYAREPQWHLSITEKGETEPQQTPCSHDRGGQALPDDKFIHYVFG